MSMRYSKGGEMPVSFTKPFALFDGINVIISSLKYLIPPNEIKKLVDQRVLQKRR